MVRLSIRVSYTFPICYPPVGCPFISMTLCSLSNVDLTHWLVDLKGTLSYLA